MRQPGAAEGCERRRRKSNVSKSTRRKYFIGSNWTAPQRNNSRSSDASGQTHQSEHADEEADIQADKAISRKDVPTEWHDRSNRAGKVAGKRCEVNYEDPKSMWHSRVWQAIRRRPAEEEVSKHWHRVIGPELGKILANRVDVKYDPRMVSALGQGI